jgi:hypothetical protein
LILSPQLQHSDLERHGLPWFIRRCHPGRRLPEYPVRLRVGQLLSERELHCQGERSRCWGWRGGVEESPECRVCCLSLRWIFFSRSLVAFFNTHRLGPRAQLWCRTVY